ncbi:hypothetical protein [Pedobacter nototheniae]|uniref:hypothetical protein n=1 Tax=Pedobacter nototheniae TaxID=2488994 RepID=UPI001040802A|nr:hypothetical protein [Pedobacter nototheniae]
MNELILKSHKQGTYLDYSEAFPIFLEPAKSLYQVSFEGWNIPYEEPASAVSIYLDLLDKDYRRSLISILPTDFYSYFPSTVGNKVYGVKDMLGVLYDNYMRNYVAKDINSPFAFPYQLLRKVDLLVDVELPDFIVETYQSLKFCVVIQRPRVDIANSYGDINFPSSGVIGGNLDYAHK